MWVNKLYLNHILEQNLALEADMRLTSEQRDIALGKSFELATQKIKDDLTIDWMRHRVNALEKFNAQLLAKVAGIFVPVPEIVPTRPGTITNVNSFGSMMPSFEDVGEDEAKRLGLEHDTEGRLMMTGTANG